MDINKEYEKMIQAADQVEEKVKDGTLTDDDLKKVMKTLRNSEGAAQRDADKEQIALLRKTDPLAKETIESKAIYDPESGLTQIVPTVAEIDPDYVEMTPDPDIDAIINSDVEATIDDEKALEFLKSNKAIRSVSDIQQIIRCMKDWENGDHSNPFNKLPFSIQQSILNEAGRGGLSVDNKIKSALAKNFIEEMIQQYYYDQGNMDMEAVLKELSDATLDLNSKIGMESFSVYLGMVESSRKISDTEDTEKNQKIKDIAAGIVSAYDMRDFMEFCEHGKYKVRPFDLQKPQKVYKEFNYKYFDHKNTINNIGAAPLILQRHGFEEAESHLIPIVFCKYCVNMKPDNLKEHTFMYYFIKNFIYLDLIAPNGNTKTMNELGDRKYIDAYKHLKGCYADLIGTIRSRIK